MKKVLLCASVGLLSTGLYAQVGINTEKPKATMDINVQEKNKDNDHLAGLLIPRVTKEKALKMGRNSNIQESTMIYVNDMNLTSTSNTTVEDITEKGYYFWNGTKWVKSAGSTSSSNAFWIKDDNDLKLNIPDAYVMKYLSTGGMLSHKQGDLNYTTWSSDGNRNIGSLNIKDDISGFNKSLANSSDITLKSSNFVVKDFNVFKLDKDINKDFFSAWNQTIIDGDILENQNIHGTFSNVEHWGTKKLNRVIGIYSSGALNGLASSANQAFGGFFDAVSNSDISTGDLYGSISRVRVNGSGNIKRIIGSRSQIGLRGGDYSPSSNIEKLIGQYIGYNGFANPRFLGHINEAYDIYAESGSGIDDSKLLKRYGVFINGAKKINYFAGTLGIGTSEATNKLEITGGNDASLTSTDSYLMLGNSKEKNIVMDNNEIMARNNGEKSTLYLQSEGGDFAIWDGLDDSSKKVRFTEGKLGIGTTKPTEKLEVNGTIKATKINFTGLPTYKDDIAAKKGGLVAGDCYKTSTGELRIKL